MVAYIKMMANKYNPKINHRKSIRLKGYDYSQPGRYFITLNCYNRKCLFGNIVSVGAKDLSPTIELNEATVVAGAKDVSHRRRIAEFKSLSKTIGSIIRGYKIGVTKWMRQNTDVHNVWQRDYYESIIRDEQSFERITQYIINNPTKWVGDKNFSPTVKQIG